MLFWITNVLNGKTVETYVLNYNRKVYESDLSGYEKLYSKRKEIAFNILESSEYHIRGFSKIIDRIKDLDIDVTPFTDNLEKLKMLLERHKIIIRTFWCTGNHTYSHEEKTFWFRLRH